MAEVNRFGLFIGVNFKCCAMPSFVESLVLTLLTLAPSNPSSLLLAAYAPDPMPIFASKTFLLCREGPSTDAFPGETMPSFIGISGNGGNFGRNMLFARQK
jgi:hypothetical protein